MRKAVCFMLCALCITLITQISYARIVAENLAQVEKLFMEEKYERVVAESTKLIDAGAHGREELFYLKGLSQMKLFNFNSARDTFRYMVERSPMGKRAFDGCIGIGDAFFLEGNIPESITAYKEVLNNYPDHKNAIVVQDKLADAYKKLGLKGKAEPVMLPASAQPKEDVRYQAGKSVDYYYVQAGYFKSKDNAQKLTERLKQKGYDSYVSAQIKSGRTYYRVKVGRFKSKGEAQILASKLKDDGYKTKVCR